MTYWNEPKFEEREKELVAEVLDSGYVSEGPMTKELEEKLAERIGVKHVIMTTSCTAALYLAIEADKRIKGYHKGTVLIPDLTFVATKNAVEMVGLNVGYLDVEKENFLILPGNRDAKIIIPVNLLGRGVKLKATDATIICDNAGALGSKVPNGTVGCYSLQGNKIISCGQGGFCVTDDDEYAKVIRQIKDFGREDKLENDSCGFNFKFNDILAAVALGQLELLEERKGLLILQYKTYKIALEEYGSFMEFKDGEVPLWVEFFPKEGKRDELFDYLKSKTIFSRKPWKSLRGLPNAKYYEENCIWLPNGPMLDIDNQDIIIEKIKEFYNETN